MFIFSFFQYRSPGTAWPPSSPSSWQQCAPEHYPSETTSPQLPSPASSAWKSSRIFLRHPQCSWRSPWSPWACSWCRWSPYCQRRPEPSASSWTHGLWPWSALACPSQPTVWTAAWSGGCGRTLKIHSWWWSGPALPWSVSRPALWRAHRSPPSCFSSLG